MGNETNNTLSEIAYCKIKNNILNNIYAPGSTLTEVLLAEELGMSRQPIRFAIHRLYEDGWINGIQRRNIRVSDVTSEDAREVYHVRNLLELGALKEIFKQDKTWEYSFALEELILKMRANINDFSRQELLDLDFHTYMLNIYDNTRIEKFYYMIRDSIYRINMLVNYQYDNITSNIDELMEIVLCIRNKNYESAETLYTKHLEKGLEFATKRLKNTEEL